MAGSTQAPGSLHVSMSAAGMAKTGQELLAMIGATLTLAALRAIVA